MTNPQEIISKLKEGIEKDCLIFWEMQKAEELLELGGLTVQEFQERKIPSEATKLTIKRAINKTAQEILKAIESDLAISEQAKKDFAEALNKNNFAEADDIFEKSLLDLLQRVERGQYPPEFFAHQGVIYWRCVVQHFRKAKDDEELEWLKSLRDKGHISLELEMEKRISQLKQRSENDKG